jgi:hypothetical protein
MKWIGTILSNIALQHADLLQLVPEQCGGWAFETPRESFWTDVPDMLQARQRSMFSGKKRCSRPCNDAPLAGPATPRKVVPMDVRFPSGPETIPTQIHYRNTTSVATTKSNRCPSEKPTVDVLALPSMRRRKCHEFATNDSWKSAHGNISVQNTNCAVCWSSTSTGYPYSTMTLVFPC